MARATNKLTARTVASQKTPGLYPDGGGLYLQVSIGRGGAVRRSWVLRYTAPDGRRREMGLGRADVVDLAKARELAQAQRKIVADRIDPLEARAERRTQQATAAARAMTFKEAAEAYIAAHEGAWRNDKHRAQWRSTLKTYAYPVIGPISVAEVDQSMVMRVLDPIWHMKTETASRVRGRIEAVLDWAAVRGHRSGDNPARWRGHLQKALPAKLKTAPVQHHRAVPFADIPDLFAALALRVGAGADCLRFLILTAARFSEAAHMTWGEVDLVGAVWTVPAQRMKGGRAHRVPLSSEPLRVLRGRLATGEEPDPDRLVFESDLRRAAAISQATLTAVLRRMGRTETVHGFRSTFRDWAAEKTGFPGEVAEAALAHVVGDRVEAAYRRGDLFEKRRALMEAWAAFCITKTKERGA